jgi:hypothetical protein
MVFLFALATVAAPLTAAAAEPSETQMVLYRALSVRHLEQTCADLAKLSATPTEDLVWLAENAEQPSWVAIRAAECVLELYPEPASPSIRAWMQSPDHLGLALVTVPHLDALPVAVAQPILEAGLAGPLAEKVRPRAAKLHTPELRALAVPPKP